MFSSTPASSISPSQSRSVSKEDGGSVMQLKEATIASVIDNVRDDQPISLT